MAIEYKIVDEFPKEIFDELVKRNLEDNGFFIRSWDYYFEGDQSYRAEAKSVRIGAYDGDKLIGLSFGRSENKNRFMMNISLVEAEYRKQGVYSKLLEMMLDQTREFDEIDSFHHLFNNKIIRLKLKYGFRIIGTDQTTMLGPRVRLRYFNNKKLLEIMEFRVGLTKTPPLND